MAHIARYEQIAYFIAQKIVSGEYQTHDKLRGRSILSSEYNVSSETIRKAMQLLSNNEVIKVIERSGNYVSSVDQAKAYVKAFETQKHNNNTVQEAQDLIDKSNQVHMELHKKMKQMVQNYEKALFPFKYFRCDIPSDSHVVGKKLKDFDFYELIKGIIIAVEIDGIVEQIPSPDMVLAPDMILYILGDKKVKERAFKYVNKA